MAVAAVPQPPKLVVWCPVARAALPQPPDGEERVGSPDEERVGSPDGVGSPDVGSPDSGADSVVPDDGEERVGSPDEERVGSPDGVGSPDVGSPDSGADSVVPDADIGVPRFARAHAANELRVLVGTQGVAVRT